MTHHDAGREDKKLKARTKRLLNKAERIIVHSASAEKGVSKMLGEQPPGRVIRFPFPWCSYDKILSSEAMDEARQILPEIIGGADEDYFLFVGVVREVKGIDCLLDAWESSQCSKTHRLLIAGRWSGPPPQTKTRAEGLANCIVLDRYLTDEEFVYFVSRSRFVILPYLDYAHSSVFLSVGWCRGAVIASDIELFREYLPDYDLSFTKGDSRALAELLDRAREMEKPEVDEYRERLRKAVAQFDDELAEALRKTLSSTELTD